MRKSDQIRRPPLVRLGVLRTIAGDAGFKLKSAKTGPAPSAGRSVLNRRKCLWQLQNRSKRRSRAAKRSLDWLQEPPRALQEAFKRPSKHLQRRCCDSDPVLVPFWSQKGGPGTSKIKEFRETSSKFCDFVVFSTSRFQDPFWDPPGLRFGSLLAPQMAETSLGIRLGSAKRPSRALCFVLGAFQERSKRPSGALQDASRRPRGENCDSRPRLEPILDPFWTSFWTLL